MAGSPPFLDRTTGTLNVPQLLSETVPLAKLVGLFVGVSLAPFALSFVTAGLPAVSALFAVVGQFVLGVGAGVVLIYVVARGRQLSERSD